ncbi:aspartic peptidase A1 [Auriscalpium vulgare]|uniref:Aspartic peptidase A1 n=1 Tax=Auriscalpium vulgare TaxID=40419 RepID=A0ACB8RR39_9AGAM|nr:aspartic peptidase A1 [Auriscalpium vulgare]
MFPTASLTALLVLAVSVVAKPIVVRDSFVTLPFAKQLNITGALDLVHKDQARAQALRAHGTARANARAQGLNPNSASAVTSIGVTNVAQVYVANVGVGSPATSYSLLIDTGSSNTWLGAGKTYVKTSTSTQTSDRVSVTYGSGSFSGTEFTDTVSLGSGLTITKQSIGVASRSSGFQGFDGILGIGPTDLTLDTLSPDTNTQIPTVTDNLASQGTIPTDLVAVSFEPTTTTSVTNGELTFGGTDSSKFTGSITFIGLTGTSPANEFWGINQSIRYSTGTTILSSTAGIVDTGTTLILIATDALTRYRSATGAVLDNTTGLLRITSAQFSNLKSLFFTTGGATFELTANAQLWPRSLNTAIGGSASSIYLVVNDLGSNSGEGLDFINGYTFLERFYSVFDTTNKRVGFATTSFTTATTN